MFEKIFNNLKKHNIDIENKKIIAGFSGGPDSTLLVHFLLHAREHYNTKFYIMHLNHKEREEADYEENYVKEFCVKNNIKCSLYVENIYENKEVKKHGFEKLARELRREYFIKDIEKYNGDYIFTGHNLDDRIETMFLNMERGTGIKGLSSMRFVNNKFIKPLLFLKRKDIRDYLEQKNIDYLHDKTNDDEQFGRNRIRHNIIPIIENYMNNGFSGIVRTLDNIIEYDDFINYVIREKFPEIIKYKDNKQIHLDINKILLYNNKIQKILLLYLISDLYIVNSKNIEDIIKIILSKKPSIKKSYKKFTVLKEYNNLKIINCEEEFELKKIKLEFDKKNQFGEYEFLIEKTLCNNIFNDNEYICVSLQAGKEFFIRTRKQGDKIIPFGHDKETKVKKIFIDYKIPKFKREAYPIIVNEKDEIIWIPFIKRTNKYKTENQKECYKIYGKKY